MLVAAASWWGFLPALASDVGAMLEAEERHLSRGLAETTLAELVLASDVVVVGTIVEERRGDWLLVSPTPNTMQVWRVRVEETVSGMVENGFIDVVYREDWYSGTTGKTVLVFGRQMPLPVGHGWQGGDPAPVVLNDILVPSEFGALFLYNDEEEGFWGPSVDGSYVPWLPERSARNRTSWLDFLQRVRDAAQQSGAQGHTIPGAHQPSMREHDRGAARLLGQLDVGPFEVPDERPPVSKRLGISSAPLRFNADEIEAAKSTFGATKGEGTRYVPARLMLMHLYAQVSAYHLALLAMESPHAAKVRELNMRILGLVAGGQHSVGHVRGVACDAGRLPKDCVVGTFPTCGTYERLRQTAYAMCASPTDHRDKVCSNPSDFGLEGEGSCVDVPRYGMFPWAEE
jgi:hypothetical protein